MNQQLLISKIKSRILATNTQIPTILQRIQGKQTIHFLHIGKTGGSAIKYALSDPDISNKLVIKLHPHQTTLRDIPPGEKVFFVLRDPITRFISGFYSRKRQGKPRYFFPWKPLEKIAFETFQSPNQLALSLSSTDREQRQKAVDAMNNINHVKDSFYRWFLNKEYFYSRLSDILFICFQENLSEDFTRLKVKLQLPDRIKLPHNDVSCHRNPYHNIDELELPAIINLKNWYQQDYAFLNLCQSIREQNILA